MANQLAESLPALWILGLAFAEILPAVIRLSQGFLLMSSIILGLVGMVAWLVNTFRVLAPVIGLVIGLYATLITASTLYSIVTASAIKTMVRFAASLVMRLAPALQTAIANLIGYTISTEAAYWATVALISAVTLGVGAVSALAGGFGLLDSNIKDATKSLRKFANGSNALGSTYFNSGSVTGGGYGSAYRDNSTTIIQAGDRDSAARQQYSSSYERQQHVDNVFGE